MCVKQAIVNVWKTLNENTAILLQTLKIDDRRQCVDPFELNIKAVSDAQILSITQALHAADARYK